MLAKALIAVFKNWRYMLLSTVVAIIAFALATWLPNFRLLYSILKDPLVPLSVKLTLPFNLLGSIATNFTQLAAAYTVIIALLIGVNVSLSVYQVRRQRQFSGGSAGVSSLGVASGVLGVGCAACNSLVLMSILGISGGAGVIGLLPLKGGEFGILGMMLLGLATYLLAKQTVKPLACET